MRKGNNDDDSDDMPPELEDVPEDMLIANKKSSEFQSNLY